jgi:RimJ/RimL family protein N-acetyltransferase
MSTPHPANARPSRVVLDGRYTRLEPIGQQHVASLYRAIALDPSRFDYLLTLPPDSEAELAATVALDAGKDDPMTWAVVDKMAGTAEGRQSLMRIVPEHGVIEIGGIYWGPNLARRRTATEALYLHAWHIFEDLGYRRFEWKCNNANEPSKRAAQRFGFQYEGVFRQHMIAKGQNRDTAWFAILDADWPRLKAEYERWLAPANFTPDGTQKSPLRFE